MSKREGVRGFEIPDAMTPHELGDALAQLVWEHFTDLISDPDGAEFLEGLGAATDEGVVPERVLEEVLIFFLWIHTRAFQLAFHGRAPDERMKEALDALHRAVFEDLVEHGTPRGQLPMLEQRVSARYAEYYQAAEVSDDRVGERAVRHWERNRPSPAERAEAVRLVRDLALTVANPLRDFLEEVDLIPE